MGIYDDKVEEVEAEAQLQPFNLAQLQHVVATLEQRWQGFDASSIADPQENNQRDAQRDAQDPQLDNRLQYPTTPKNFNTFHNLRTLRYDSKHVNCRD